jgi:cytochrome P450
MYYRKVKTDEKLRKFIDVNTGKPVPSLGYWSTMLMIIVRYFHEPTIVGLLRMSKKYGPVYAMYGVEPTVVFTRPDDVKTILKKIDDFPKRQFPKGSFLHVEPILGSESVANVNGSVWHNQRLLLNKAFFNNAIFFEPMKKKVDICISRWKQNPKNVPIGHDFQKMTLDVLASCIFGVEFDTLNGQISEPLAAYNYSMDRVFNPLRFIFPLFNKMSFLETNKKMFQQLKIFDEYCWSMINDAKKKVQEKKNSNDSSDNGFHSVIELMTENGLSEAEIRDNVSLFFLAGHETTALTLSWLVSLLVRYPEVQEKARKEVFEKVPNETSYEILKELPYLDGLIKETLRIHPPLLQAGNRIVPKDTTLGSVRIPAGFGVGLDFVSMAFDKTIWGDNPEIPKPERWFQATKDQRNAWMPFAIGPRVCIGMNFSLIEQKIFLIELLKTFKDIKLSPTGSVETQLGRFLYTPNFDKLLVDFSK